MLLELDQRAEEILRVHERDAIAVDAALFLATAERLYRVLRELGLRDAEIADVEAEMVDAAVRIALEKARDR
jgi:hypothetical protein